MPKPPLAHHCKKRGRCPKILRRLGRHIRRLRQYVRRCLASWGEKFVFCLLIGSTCSQIDSQNKNRCFLIHSRDLSAKLTGSDSYGRSTSCFVSSKITPDGVDALNTCSIYTSSIKTWQPRFRPKYSQQTNNNISKQNYKMLADPAA